MTRSSFDPAPLYPSTVTPSSVRIANRVSIAFLVLFAVFVALCLTYNPPATYELSVIAGDDVYVIDHGLSFTDCTDATVRIPSSFCSITA